MFKLNYEALACKIHLSLRGQRNSEGKFDWSEACIDGAILCGITGCTNLGILVATHNVTQDGLIILGTAILGEFLLFLATKRRLVPKKC